MRKVIAVGVIVLAVLGIAALYGIVEVGIEYTTGGRAGGVGALALLVSWGVAAKVIWQRIVMP